MENKIKKNLKRVRISNPITAIVIFYTYPELSTKEIKKLFGISSSSTVKRLKDEALRVMKDKNVLVNERSAINTDCAYEAWGIDVKDLEKRQKKLEDLQAKGWL